MSDYSGSEPEFDEYEDGAEVEPVYGEGTVEEDTTYEQAGPPPPLGSRQMEKAAAYDGPDHDPEHFHGAFWSTATERNLPLDRGLDDLMILLHQGNDFCKDLVEVYKERAGIEEHYAKSLQKLHGKCARLGEHTYGSLRTALDRQLLEFEERAAWHFSHAEMLRKRMTKPTLEFAAQQGKEFKMHTKPLDKQLKILLDVEAVVTKCQKNLNAKSHSVESAAVHVAVAQNPPDGRPAATSKELAKLNKAVSKARINKNKAQKRYLESQVKLRVSREDWETVTIKGYKALQKMEEKRVGYLKTILTDLANTYHRLLPEMQKSLGELVKTADNINGADTVAAECSERGTGPFLAVKRLYTGWEENMDANIDRERRVQELAASFRMCKDELARSQKTREGIEKLYNASRDVQHEKQSSMAAVMNVKRQLEAHDYILAADYANVHKLRLKLCSSLRRESPAHSLAGYIREHNDRKPPMAVLQLPAFFVFDAAALATEERQLAQFDADLLSAAGSGGGGGGDGGGGFASPTAMPKPPPSFSTGQPP
eukprot:UC1_evm1s2168